MNDHPAAVEEHAGLGEERNEAEQRDVEGLLAVGLDAAREQALVPLREALGLGVLLGEGLDHVHAGDVLLGRGGDVGHLLLHVAEHGVGDVAVAVCDSDDKRRHCDRHQRQPPVEVEHHRGHTEHGQHVLGEEDQSVAEEEANQRQVDRRARE